MLSQNTLSLWFLHKNAFFSPDSQPKSVPDRVDKTKLGENEGRSDFCKKSIIFHANNNFMRDCGLLNETIDGKI